MLFAQHGRERESRKVLFRSAQSAGNGDITFDFHFYQSKQALVTTRKGFHFRSAQGDLIGLDR